MRWVRDQTGRLPLRPHFQPDEIDRECELLVAGHLRRRGRAGAPSLTTDDLAVLLEGETADLDLYADLSAYGPDAEGVTDFVPGERPRVRIAAALSERPDREPRLRTTLAHELGHVRLHACLWTLDDTPPDALRPRCRRRSIERPAQADWLEWQAAYAGGAILMPSAAVQRLVSTLVAPLLGVRGGPVLLHAGGTLAGTLTRRVAGAFGVSPLAARVRLLQLGYLHGGPGGPGGRSRPFRRTGAV